MSDFVPRSVYTSGKASSAAGLTAAVVKVALAPSAFCLFSCVSLFSYSTPCLLGFFFALISILFVFFLLFRTRIQMNSLSRLAPLCLLTTWVYLCCNYSFSLINVSWLYAFVLSLSRSIYLLTAFVPFERGSVALMSLTRWNSMIRWVFSRIPCPLCCIHYFSHLLFPPFVRWRFMRQWSSRRYL